MDNMNNEENPQNDQTTPTEEQNSIELSESFRLQAQSAFQAGEYEEAISLLGQASQANPSNPQIPLDLVQMYLHTGHLDKAKALMEKLPEEAKESTLAAQLVALIRYSEIVAESPDIQDIQATLKTTPNDPDALYALSGFLMINNQPEPTIQTLLQLFTVHRDFKEGIAQKMLIELFDLLQPKHPELVGNYRRKFQNMLF